MELTRWRLDSTPDVLQYHFLRSHLSNVMLTGLRFASIGALAVTKWQHMGLILHATVVPMMIHPSVRLSGWQGGRRLFIRLLSS